uniref:Uncharacterized protein n=1 Tax=Fagus sylvatica TaxID=28930 RepID=A0A2N9EH96_FAGSY
MGLVIHATSGRRFVGRGALLAKVITPARSRTSSWQGFTEWWERKLGGWECFASHLKLWFVTGASVGDRGVFATSGERQFQPQP